MHVASVHCSETQSRTGPGQFLAPSNDVRFAGAFVSIHRRSLAIRDKLLQRGGGIGSPSARRQSQGSTRPTSGREPICTGDSSATGGLCRSAIAKLKM